jgi:hypothetical protein
MSLYIHYRRGRISPTHPRFVGETHEKHHVPHLCGRAMVGRRVPHGRIHVSPTHEKSRLRNSFENHVCVRNVPYSDPTLGLGSAWWLSGSCRDLPENPLGMDNCQPDQSARFHSRALLKEECCGISPNCVNHPLFGSWVQSYGATVPEAAEWLELWRAQESGNGLDRNGTYSRHREEEDTVVPSEALLTSQTNFQELDHEAVRQLVAEKCVAPGRSVSLDEIFPNPKLDAGLQKPPPLQNLIEDEEEKNGEKEEPLQNLIEDEEEKNGEKEEVCCVVDNLTEFDVLCGRGEQVNRHPGNKIFHDEKEKLQPRYLRATKRKEKTAIAQELVDLMKNRYGSRFLGYRSEKKQFYIVENKRVLEKAKQVLRETFTPEQRKVKRERYFRPKKKMFYAQCLADLCNAKT